MLRVEISQHFSSRAMFNLNLLFIHSVFDKKNRMLICLVRLLLEAFPCFSSNIALMLSCSSLVSFIAYPWASKNSRHHNMLGIASWTPINSLSVDDRATSFCFAVWAYRHCRPHCITSFHPSPYHLLNITKHRGQMEPRQANCPEEELPTHISRDISENESRFMTTEIG